MNIENIVKSLSIEHNVCIQVMDKATNKIVSKHCGHNVATNSMLVGVGHYLTGDGVYNQGYHTLSSYVPRYISLGTMGLFNQDSDDNGLPVGIGVANKLSEAERFQDYIDTRPGYGADGYDGNVNNNREYFGLGPIYANRSNKSATVNCELISPSFPRTPITYRDIIPETKSELAQTIDIIFSAFISTGALAQFREPDKDYLYITEAGLWADKTWTDSGSNGLLAGYRICPPNRSNWDMSDEMNRNILKQSILRVGINQVVQVVWKIQIGERSALSN